MPTDTGRAPASARNFALRLIAWSMALFGVLRLPWISLHLILPATQWQAAAGAAIAGPSRLPVAVTLACSGADALALCLAALLAYPARWRTRTTGIVAAVAGVIALNTLRIGTLGRAVASPRVFVALHVYVWPAVLTAAIAAYVLIWMRLADRPRPAAPAPPRAADTEVSWRVSGVFAITAGIFLVLFVVAAPLYLESARVLAVAALVARAAAWLLRGLGVDATAAGTVVSTSRGAFLVTQECISTPLIPVYFAAAVAYGGSWRARIAWAVAGVPLFIALGIARLLVVALPSSLGVPAAFSIHAFSQLLVAGGMICGVAVWRFGPTARTAARTVFALVLASLFLRGAAGPYTHAVLWIGRSAVPLDDPQGALMFLPGFQCALFLGLWVAGFTASGWTRFAAGAALLVSIQVAIANGVALLFLAGVTPLVRDVRAWALVAPALVILTTVNFAASRR